jgi:hypothetical protein
MPSNAHTPPPPPPAPRPVTRSHPAPGLQRLEAVSSLVALAGLQSDMRVLVSGLGRCLAAAPQPVLARVLKLALEPMEAQVRPRARGGGGGLGGGIA